VPVPVAVGRIGEEVEDRTTGNAGSRPWGFYGNLSRTQIAEQVGLSQMHGSRLITGALATLRSHLDDSDARGGMCANGPRPVTQWPEG
jgi:hypothetical protein